MKSIVFVAKNETQFVNEPKPVCEKDTILLKTLYSGMTNGTERNLLTGGSYGGTWPIKRTYQTISKVIECGEEITQYKVGDLVFSGLETGHVEYHTAKESDLIAKIPEGFDLAAGALMGIASVPLHVARRADIRVDDNVLVFGAGLVGAFAAQAANLMGAKVTVADLNQDRLDMIKRLGVAETINTGTEEGKKALWDGRPYSVILECSGANLLDLIIGKEWGGKSGLIGFRGRLVLVAGRYDVTYTYNSAQCDEISVVHTSHFDKSDLELMIRYVQTGKVQIRPYIQNFVKVDDALPYYTMLRDEPGKLLGTVFDWT